MRLIDADALMKKHCKDPAKGDCKNCDWYGDSWCRCEIFGVQIADALTIEAEPVRHGRWEFKSRMYQIFDEVEEEPYIECNLCKREEYVPFEFDEKNALDYAKQNYPYCHCGAQMDGE